MVVRISWGNVCWACAEQSVKMWLGTCQGIDFHRLFINWLNTLSLTTQHREGHSKTPHTETERVTPKHHTQTVTPKHHTQHREGHSKTPHTETERVTPKHHTQKQRWSLQNITHSFPLPHLRKTNDILKRDWLGEMCCCEENLGIVLYRWWTWCGPKPRSVEPVGHCWPWTSVNVLRSPETSLNTVAVRRLVHSFVGVRSNYVRL